MPRKCVAFLCCCQYYSRFIPKYNDLIGPISHYLAATGKTKFIWNQEYQHCWDALKSSLNDCTKMYYPTDGNTYILRTDASIIAVGGELVATREIDGVTDKRPIFFFSVKLNGAQKSYHVQELEALAILESLNRSMKITNCKRILVETDHAALVQ